MYIRLLKLVRDKVFTPSAIVRAFEACGYRPFDFQASFACKWVPLPPSAICPILSPTRMTHANNTSVLLGEDMSQETHSITRSSHSAESTKSSRHRQSAILAEINERITRLGDRPTPRRLRVIQQDLAQHTRLATSRNDIIGTYAHVAVLRDYQG